MTKSEGQLLLQKEKLVMRKLFLLVFGVILMWNGMAIAGPNTLIFMPFRAGETWYCTQGPGGGISHYKQPTLYAYDLSQRGNGVDLRGDPAFGQDIVSPIRGTVAQVVKDVPDFSNNDGSNAKNNHGWGNQVIIKDISGDYIRICHMKQDSAKVSLNQLIEIGTPLGQVGQTGFSTSPHAHIQLQNKLEGGSSLPFIFVEGRLRCGGWNESRNATRASVLDNDGSTNLGNDFLSSKVIVEGQWDSYKEGQGFNGANYFRHKVEKNDSAKITWTFILKTSGRYELEANWIAIPSRDTTARYTIFGTTRNRDQSIPLAGRPGFWIPLADSVNLQAGVPYTVSLQGTTEGKTVVADSMILRRL